MGIDPDKTRGLWIAVVPLSLLSFAPLFVGALFSVPCWAPSNAANEITAKAPRAAVRNLFIYFFPRNLVWSHMRSGPTSPKLVTYPPPRTSRLAQAGSSLWPGRDTDVELVTFHKEVPHQLCAGSQRIPDSPNGLN